MRFNRILHLINAFIVLFAVVLGIVLGAYTHMLICLTYVLGIEAVLLLNRKDTSVCTFLITLYLQIIGPIDILVVLLSPISVAGIAYAGYVGLAEDTDLLWQYCFHSLGFYAILILAYWAFSKLSIGGIFGTRSTEDGIGTGGTVKMRINWSLWVFAIVFSAIYYLARVTLNIDVSGKTPLIPLAGVVVYLFRFLKFLLLFKGINRLSKATSFTVWGFLFGILYILILNLSDVLLDRRAPVFYCLLIFVFFLYVVKPNETLDFARKHKLLTVGAVILVFLLFAVWSENVRYSGKGVEISSLYLLSRLIGLVPGLIGLNYINNTQDFAPFSLLDYFANTFGSRGSSINKVFTYTILQYPTTAVHRSAVPLFIGSRFYGNFAGFILFPVLFGLIFAFAKKLTDSSKKYRGSNNIAFQLSAFIGCYLTVYAVSAIMNGNGEQLIDLFTVPLLFIIYRYIAERVSVKLL